MTAKEMYRELPFTISLEDHDGDTQIVQGVVDCLFQEQNGLWVLLDYKTDRIQPNMKTMEGLQKEMIHRYDVQLSLYKKALEEILQIDIHEKIIYSFDARCPVQL
jgi:DNA helicase/exodeoxyribonuclease V, subunit A (EC 3.1.11.5)